MPVFGYGTYKLLPHAAIVGVSCALSCGYRMIDTASFYGNEKEIGKAVQSAQVSRQDVFLTTKVWNTDQGYQNTLKAFERSRLALDTDYIDLYLVHWPMREHLVATWEALESIYQSGKVRAIGVSNFHESHIALLLEKGYQCPMVNQIELHPYLNQEKLRKYCLQKNIAVESWSPVMKGNAQHDPVLMRIADKYDKTAVQVTLRWHIQHGLIPIPKSQTADRIQENIDVFDFTLEEKDMKKIDQFNKPQRYGSHPEKVYINGIF